MGELSRNERLLKLTESLTKLKGSRLRSFKKNEKSASDVQQREPASWLPQGLIEVPRFEIPMDVHEFTELTPLNYLTKYCVVSSRVKKLLYHRVFTKFREPKCDGIDSFDKLKKALKDVCSFSISSNNHSPSENSLNYFVHGVLDLDLDEELKLNYKNFMGIAALAERLFNPNYISSWLENEKRLEADYHVYKKLREQEQDLKYKLERKDQENQKAAEESSPWGNEERRNSGETESAPTLTSKSIDNLMHQIKENRKQLENKISVTKILELGSRPGRCPKDIMEQVDFFALKWKLIKVNLSPAMQRIIKIIVNL